MEVAATRVETGNKQLEKAVSHKVSVQCMDLGLLYNMNAVGANRPLSVMMLRVSTKTCVFPCIFSI